MLSKEFSDAEIINYIVTFYHDFAGGYLDSDLDREDGARKFANNGYAEMDDEHSDFYRLSKKGEGLLHECIAKITKDFTKFVAGRRVSIDEASQWFTQQYQLSDAETSNEICDYIVSNSHNYSKTLRKGHSSRFGDYIEII